MSGRLFNTRTATAYDRYSRDLTSAVKHRQWIQDPSFALGTDDMVYEKVRRDAIAAQAMIYRRHLVAGREVLLEPASNDRASQLATAAIAELVGHLLLFGEGRFELASAVFRGSAYQAMEGSYQRIAVGGLPAAQWWVPQRLTDVDRRRFRLSWDAKAGGARWNLWSVQRERWEELRHPEHFVRHVYQRTEDTLGYGRGLLDSLHYYQAAKMRVVQEGLAACERFGQGFMLAAVEGLRQGSEGRGNDAHAQRYLDQLNKHRARNAFVHPKGDEVKLMTGFGEGWQLIRELLNYLDNAIRILILGANLPTSATGGGSYALAEVQQNSTEALIAFDREILSEVLTRDLVGLVWALNRPTLRALGLGQVRAPKLRVRQETKVDPEAFSRLLEAALRAGLRVKTSEVYKRLGLTQPSLEDEVLAGAPAAPAPGTPQLEPPTAPPVSYEALRDQLRVLMGDGGTPTDAGVRAALDRVLSAA